MNTPDFKRKLTAIFHADVKGYSLLMGEDEEATLHTLSTYLEVMSTFIQRHRGRVVGTEGDAILAEFGSVVDAVRCAVKIQETLRIKNAALPESRKMEFRIGINLGDVIEEGDQIYGDGVNIAARIEGLADGGGICISETVHDQIENKLALGYEYQGKQTVKNIKKPVKIYRVLMDPKSIGKTIGQGKYRTHRGQWAVLVVLGMLFIVAGILTIRHYNRRPTLPSLEIASEEKMAFPLPEKPSIAVLPFVNISDDPSQEYFSDGMTDDLITDLSKISGLFVIARNSVFTYKGKNVKVEQISRELGVRYVLEGSVRKAGEHIRINAQLIDASTGGHVWAERYDRNLKDIFALQDEVTQKIVAALVVKLTRDEKRRLVRKGTDNIEAYDYTLQGVDYFFRFTPDENALAQQMFKKAIDLDPKYALAYSWLGYTYWMEWAFRWSATPRALERALGLAQKALSLDASLSQAHTLLGKIYLWQKKHGLAITELETAIALNPNYADGLAGLGEIMNFAGRPEEAITLLEKAIRLNPIPPVWYFHNLGSAYYLTKRYGEAITTLKRVLNRNPNFWPTYIYLTASFAETGEEDKARIETVKLLKANPDFSLKQAKQKLPFKDQAVMDRLGNALYKAGLKQ